MGRLLVVDDSPTVRKLVELTFRSSEWSIDFAASGAEGVRLAVRHVHDVILLDLVLPDMRGIDVCARLASDPRARKIPIVLMSAKDESARREFKPYPAVVDFVQKPFTKEVLTAKITVGRTVGHNIFTLSGTVRGWPVSEVIALFAGSGRTGELRFERGGSTVLVYFRCGEIAFITSLDPADHDRKRAGSAGDASPDVLAAAVQSQRATGKPIQVTLAERGALPADCDLVRAVHDVGRALLVRVLESDEQSFAWRELASLPPYVEAYGRTVPAVLHAHEADRWPTKDAVLFRTRSFSDRIRNVSLNARERRVLMMIDGNTSVETIAMRSGLEIDYAGHIARSLVNRGLIEGEV